MQVDRIFRIVKSFDPGWHQQLRRSLTIELRETITSAYTSRNSIAHGEDVDLTFRQVSTYYEQIKTVIGAIESVVVAD